MVNEVHKTFLLNNKMQKEYIKKGGNYLGTLCDFKPSRSTGSAGNKKATSFFARTVKRNGFQVRTDTFNCLDFKNQNAILKSKSKNFSVFPSPFSLGCKVKTELVCVSSIEELATCCCIGKLLLLKDKICNEQLMPKEFVFYNPEHHKKIYSLLQKNNPAAIITATKPNPDLVGAIYPYPLIEDGDFNIPSCYCSRSTGQKLSKHEGEIFELVIKAKRIFTKACNVVASKNPKSDRKIVICAHIDSRAGTPGASDNASGTVVLLLLAEMLSDYQGDNCIEIVALNGEDHFSVAGQMDYLRLNKNKLGKIIMAINIDDVGYKKGKTSYTFYQCSNQTKQFVRMIFSKNAELMEGEPWYNGDHMIFSQNSVESIALTSANSAYLMRNITHTQKDKPEIIKIGKLVEIANGLKKLVLNLNYRE